jgi:PHP family Zn ribbon phosphoesterase
MVAGRLRRVELVISIAASAGPATLLAMWSAVDLHLHTTHSDGKGSPENVVRAAHQRGIGMVAITDHHTVAGFDAARQAGRRLGASVLPGVELTCPSGGAAVHLLGVFPSVRFDADKVATALKLNEAGLGDPAGVVPYSLINAVKRIHDLGGLAIAPHASARRGLLKEYQGHSRAWVAARVELDAIELPEARNPYRSVALPREFAEVPVISGSDAHELRDGVSMSHPYGPGARPFWALMSPAPNFLRLRPAASGPTRETAHRRPAQGQRALRSCDCG